jgi:shikimate dehydrogenase
MMLHGLAALKFASVNVTFPYKEAVVPLLGELAPSAELVGATSEAFDHVALRRQAALT